MSVLHEHLRAVVGDFIEAHPPAPSPSPRDVLQVLGIVLVAAAVLVCNRYLMLPLSVVLAAQAGSVAAEPQPILWALLVAVGYVLPPLIYCWWALPCVRSALGLIRPRLWEALRLWLCAGVVLAPVLAVLTALPSFQASYPMAGGNSGDPWSLALWMLAYGLQFVGLEVFFRGFLLLALRRVLGLWGLGVMVLPYTMLHFQKPPLEALGSVFFGLMLGILALRTRSVIEGVGVHLVVAYSLELLALQWLV